MTRDGPDRASSHVYTDRGISIITLKNRRDFLKAARARRCRRTGFMLHARERQRSDCDSIRIGLTCSKRMGNAVTRNRAKRRLREAVRIVLPESGRPGWDYVLIGIPGETICREFKALLSDFQAALKQVHGPARKTDTHGAGR